MDPLIFTTFGSPPPIWVVFLTFALGFSTCTGLDLALKDLSGID
jgi:hypothetical protein